MQPWTEYKRTGAVYTANGAAWKIDRKASRDWRICRETRRIVLAVVVIVAVAAKSEASRAECDVIPSAPYIIVRRGRTAVVSN